MESLLRKNLFIEGLLVLLLLANTVFAADPLPSWNDTRRKAIVAFVDK